MNGSWQLRVTGRDAEIRSFVLDSAGDRVAFQSGLEWFAFEADGAGGWAETTPVMPGEGARWFDPALDSFVVISAEREPLRIQVLPLDGSAGSDTNVTLPAGYGRQEFAGGSGRVFMLARTGAATPVLFWWNALDGGDAGQLSLPHFRDGMRASSNGRTLSFWDLDSYTVRVLDTASLQQPVAIRLGICRSNGTSEASEDGRWFLISDCRNNLQLIDLLEPENGFRSPGIKRTGRVLFATGSPEIVWIDSNLRVNSYHPLTGVRQVLYTLDEYESRLIDPQWLEVRLNRNAGLLALPTGRGMLRLQQLGDDRAFTQLPPLPFTEAGLELAASAEPTDGLIHQYRFTGSFTLLGETLEIDGTVSGGGWHDYVPVAPEFVPLVSSPRPMWGAAEVSETASGEVRFRLNFGSSEREATVFHGGLQDIAGEVRYWVELERDP
jgi:hypothetical protein